MNVAGRLAQFTGGKKLEKENWRGRGGLREKSLAFTRVSSFRDFSSPLCFAYLDGNYTGGGKLHGEYKLGK